MLIKFGFGQLYIGHPDWIEFDACIALYLGKRGIVPPSELPWRFIWRLAWNWLPNSARWAARDSYQSTVHRMTWRSKVYVYLTGQKERANPSHLMWVCPGSSLPKNEIPFEWKQDGSDDPLTFAVEFKHGRAEVENRLGEWMIEHGMAQRTNLIRPTKALLGSLASRIAGR